MFAAAACYACHRFRDGGGMNGPGPHRSGRALFAARDLLDQIINPSKEINEQFAPVVVTLNNGDVVSGVDRESQRRSASRSTPTSPIRTSAPTSTARK
jgi:putative heme-binding domain-containing protein